MNYEEQKINKNSTDMLQDAWMLTGGIAIGLFMYYVVGQTLIHLSFGGR
jgi:hypothetical protein